MGDVGVVVVLAVVRERQYADACRIVRMLSLQNSRHLPVRVVVLVELGVVAGDERAGGLACGSREDGSDEGEGGCEDDGGLHCCVAVALCGDGVRIVVCLMSGTMINRRAGIHRRSIKQECQKRVSVVGTRRVD